jgi:hypothetical protein
MQIGKFLICVVHRKLFFPPWLDSFSGPKLTVEVSKSHWDTPYAVGFLWTSDRLVAETTHRPNIRQTSTPLSEFGPTIPTSEWPHTHAIDCAAPGDGPLDVVHIVTESVQSGQEVRECGGTINMYLRDLT